MLVMPALAFAQPRLLQPPAERAGCGGLCRCADTRSSRCAAGVDEALGRNAKWWVAFIAIRLICPKTTAGIENAAGRAEGRRDEAFC